MIISISKSSYHLLIGNSISECKRECQKHSKDEIRFFLLNDIMVLYDFQNIVDWVGLFFTRCAAVDSTVNSLLLNPAVISRLSISCLSDQDIPIASNLVAVTRFVNVMSWIGVFQIIMVMSMIIAAIFRRKFQTHYGKRWPNSFKKKQYQQPIIFIFIFTICLSLYIHILFLW